MNCVVGESDEDDEEARTTAEVSRFDSFGMVRGGGCTEKVCRNSQNLDEDAPN